MVVFIRTLFFFYMIFPFPYLIGKAVCEDKKGEKTILKSIFTGYVITVSIYYVVSQFAIWKSLSLKQFTILNMVIVMTITLIIVLVKQRGILYWLKEFWDSLIIAKWYMKIVALVTIVVSFVMVFLGKSNNSGGSAEIALTAWTTDTLMEINPYTGEAYSEAGSRLLGQTYALGYAMAGKMLSQNPVTLMKYFFPFVWIPMAFAAVYLLGAILLESDYKKTTIFLVVFLALNIMGFSGEQSQIEGLMLNSWEGQSILVNIIMPILWSYCLECILWLERQKFGKKSEAIKRGLILVCICVSAHSMSGYGLLLCVLVIMVFIGIYLMRRWRHYVRNSESD